MYKVIGYDIATHTGYAVLDQDRKLIECGIIDISKEKDYRDKFRLFRKELLRLQKEHSPKAVAYENVYSGPNPVTTAFLNNLRGVAFELVSPKIQMYTDVLARIRKEVLGKGNLSKQEVFAWASAAYPSQNFVYSKHNDITDAILLAQWGLLQLKK